MCKVSNLPKTLYMCRKNSMRRADMTANICISKEIIVFSIIKGSVPSKKHDINVLYKENKMSKYKYHKDVVYKEKTKKVCKMNCQKDR